MVWYIRFGPEATNECSAQPGGMMQEDTQDGSNNGLNEWRCASFSPILEAMIAQLLNHIRRGTGLALFGSILGLAEEQIRYLEGSSGAESQSSAYNNHAKYYRVTAH